MRGDAFEGFKPTNVDNEDLEQRPAAEDVLQALSKARQEHPTSSLVGILDTFSGGDLTSLDTACNNAGSSFSHLGVYEAYEEPEDVEEVRMLLLKLASVKGEEEKQTLAKEIAKKII